MIYSENKMTKALVLRTCNSDLTSYGGFQWPFSGKVIAPDWDPVPECGKGLHGALYGEGDGSLFNWDDDAKWLVVEVELESIIDLGSKVKFPECEIKYCGDRVVACKYLQENGCAGRSIIGGNHVSTDKKSSSTGYNGISTSGYRGTSISGDWGTSISGHFGRSISGDYGTSTSGHRGKSLSGHNGKSMSGDWGESISGYSGVCQAGENGIITSKWFDGNRWRIVTGYVEEDGIGANVPYTLDENGKWKMA